MSASKPPEFLLFIARLWLVTAAGSGVRPFRGGYTEILARDIDTAVALLWQRHAAYAAQSGVQHHDVMFSMGAAP